jgi:hypothetical protein
MRLLPLLAKPRVPARPRRAPPPAADSDDAPPRGCAWFDSSHELGQGVVVSVHEGSAELAQLVPARWWLQWELEAALQSVRR